MEKRAFLAVALMAAVLILYQTFLVPRPGSTVAPPQNQAEQADPGASADSCSRPGGGPAESTAPAAPTAPAEPRPRSGWPG